MSTLRVSAALVVCVVGPVGAQDIEQMRRAMQIGTIIGSEQYCGLEYDQSAIERWIDENTDPADMGFGSTMHVGISAEEYEQSSRSGSAKTAHCRSIQRSAAHYGFTAE